MSSLPSFGMAGGFAPMSSSSSFERQVSSRANAPACMQTPGLPIDPDQIGARGQVLSIARNNKKSSALSVPGRSEGSLRACMVDAQMTGKFSSRGSQMRGGGRQGLKGGRGCRKGMVQVKVPR